MARPPRISAPAPATRHRAHVDRSGHDDACDDTCTLHGRAEQNPAQVDTDCSIDRAERTVCAGYSHAQSATAGRPLDMTPAESGFPFAKHRLSDTPEYFVYRGMLARCYSPTMDSWPFYGGRGIAVCERWRASFVNFLSDVGRRPSPRHSIERRDVNGDYEPGNVCWATELEQANNRRTSRRVAGLGRMLTLAQWARELGISARAMKHRVDSGWPAERMFAGPERRRARGAS